jgi:hypothetical protein
MENWNSETQRDFRTSQGWSQRIGQSNNYKLNFRNMRGEKAHTTVNAPFLVPPERKAGCDVPI